jgi:serine/threonine protein kinase/WD40 repeat protein
LVAAVLEAPQAQREALISARCAADPELEREVRSLIRHKGILDDPDHPLSDHAIAALAAEFREDTSERKQAARAPGPGLAGETIGGYRLLRILGEGGMGIVYEAEQSNPRRRVALKFLDGLRGLPEGRRRFEIEAEILGRLHHPGIAQVYEAGSAPSSLGGSPRSYFAMELIEGGLPITVYAEQASLDVQARLELTASVADAIDHAHRCSVIHRDLKPENVLITPEGKPKVLDFGIARVAGDSTLAATTMTREGQILGTLAYMAPEQLAGDPTRIGAPSDVYALGVILFELLAGRLPLDLGGLSISAAIRLIEFETPPRLGSVNKNLRGDIESIVETCLRQEPGRRYTTAAALAADIRRYLANKPILTRRPTLRYKTTKYIRRNRALVSATLIVVLVVIVGAIVTSMFALGRQRAQLAAEFERTNARLREVESTRGLLSSAQLQNEQRRPWESVRQLHAVPASSRGWEWRHLDLAVPWVLDRGPERSLLQGARNEYCHGFVQDTLLVGFTPQSDQVWVHDVTTNTRTNVQLDDLTIEYMRAWKNAPPGQVAIVRTDGQTGALDTTTGRFTPWALAFDSRNVAGGYPAFYPSPDPRIIVAWGGPTLTVYLDGAPVFAIDSGLPNPLGMHWNRPEFSPDGKWIYLAHWGDFGEIIAVSTETWTEHARATTGSYGPLIALTPDGSRLYSTTFDGGIDLFSAPDLIPIGTIAREDGMSEGLAVSPTGDRLAVFFPDIDTMRVIDTTDHSVLFEHRMGSVNRNIDLSFSPDGRLILGATPETRMTWLVDAERPVAETVTRLRGHNSWIYQLAISPDGSLLASAAPEGDILLWDLRADRLLTRIPRHHAPDTAVLAHNMNAPLVFDPTGTHLLFAEIQPTPLSHGVTRLNLKTGQRTRVNTSSYNATLDAVARELMPRRPINLFHHAALLADGRILQSTAAGLGNDDIVVRAIGDEPAAEKLLANTRARLWIGVAPHPSGHEYAHGEYLILRIRDAATDEVRFEITEGVWLPGYALAYSPDGRRLAMGTEDARVIIYETEFYKKIADIQLPDDLPNTDRNYAFNVMWTPDATRLVTCGDTEIRILESERPLVREQKRAAWEADLARARAMLAGTAPDPAPSPAALLIAQIERWGGHGRPETTLHVRD